MSVFNESVPRGLSAPGSSGEPSAGSGPVLALLPHHSSPSPTALAWLVLVLGPSSGIIYLGRQSWQRFLLIVQFLGSIFLNQSKHPVVNGEFGRAAFESMVTLVNTTNVCSIAKLFLLFECQSH